MPSGACPSQCRIFTRAFPSAEVRGHGRGRSGKTGKRYVAIKHIESVGNYAIKLSFNDGHDSGIYSWDYLLELGENEGSLWQDYLAKLRQAGQTREPLPADTHNPNQASCRLDS